MVLAQSQDARSTGTAAAKPRERRWTLVKGGRRIDAELHVTQGDGCRR